MYIPICTDIMLCFVMNERKHYWWAEESPPSHVNGKIFLVCLCVGVVHLTKQGCRNWGANFFGIQPMPTYW